jgi:hypothetical protein
MSASRGRSDPALTGDHDEVLLAFAAIALHADNAERQSAANITTPETRLGNAVNEDIDVVLGVRKQERLAG